MGKRWYEIKAKGDDTAEVWIYDEIGMWGISAKEFNNDLNKVTASKINLRINSPGGSVFDGTAIFNALKRHKAEVTTYIDGIAASIASVIALAGDKVVIADNALFMIHNPWAMAIGDANEMRKTAEILDKTRDSIMAAYSAKTGMSEAELMSLMDAETWYNAGEAKDAGFVDEIEGQADMAACASFDFKKLGFSRVPMNLIKKEIKDSVVPTAENTKAPMVAELKEGIQMPEPAVAVPAPSGAGAVAVVPNNSAVEIMELAASHNISMDKVTAWVKEGKSIEQVSREILDSKRTAPIPQPAAERAVVMTEKEKKQYSIANAIRVAADSAEGRGDFSCFEREVSDEIAKKLPSNYSRKGGFFVPLAAGLDSGTGTAGAELKFTQAGELIDLLRNASVVVRKGARVINGLNGPVTFPKQSGAGTASWVAENPGSDVADSNLTLGTVALAPKTLQSSTSYSRQLLAQSVVSIEGMVRQDLAAIHALAWDLAALHGTGNNNQPTGIYAASGVNAKAMGGVPTFGKLVDMITEVLKDNALIGSLGWVTTPGMAGKLAQTVKASGTDSTMIWTGPLSEGILNGYVAEASNQVSSTLGGGSNEHGIIFGNWNDLLIGMWGAMELVVDPYRLKKQGMIEVTSFQMVDIALRHAESFCKSTGATIA